MGFQGGHHHFSQQAWINQSIQSIEFYEVCDRSPPAVPIPKDFCSWPQAQIMFPQEVFQWVQGQQRCAHFWGLGSSHIGSDCFRNSRINGRTDLCAWFYFGNNFERLGGRPGELSDGLVRGRISNVDGDLPSTMRFKRGLNSFVTIVLDFFFTQSQGRLLRQKPDIARGLQVQLSDLPSVERVILT